MKHSQKVLCIHLQMAHFEVLTEDCMFFFFLMLRLIFWILVFLFL